ncbi:MAG: HAD family hydrolase [Clostridia bacterium]|nr:HAD family hydrolase [Clostridia bacterium]
MQRDILLFDLDGTLTESGEGILKSVQYALSALGIAEPDTEKLRVFIGPPLLDSFMRYYGMSKETAAQAVALYRERFRAVGMFENKLYPGVADMLQTLRAAGCTLAVASSKPEPFVRTILSHFGILDMFREVVGSTMDEKRTAKADVIEEALRRLQASEQRERVVLVGDTLHDVLGAKQAGVACAAVLYGYGTRAELAEAGATCLAETVEELKALLLQGETA